MPLICNECENQIYDGSWFPKPSEVCKNCIFTADQEPSEFCRKDNC